MVGEDEIDVEALLLAQSSDEDDTDLPELGRSIDDILNDVYLGDDMVEEHVETGGEMSESTVEFGREGSHRTSYQISRLSKDELKRSKLSDFGNSSPASPFQLMFPLSSKPSPRPGAAFAAALAASAASKQVVSPILSRRTSTLSEGPYLTAEANRTEPNNHSAETFHDGGFEQEQSVEELKDTELEAGFVGASGDVEDAEPTEYFASELVDVEDVEPSENSASDLVQEDASDDSTSSSNSSILYENEQPNGTPDGAPIPIAFQVREANASEEPTPELFYSPLLATEELEKRAANSGFDLEEGAASLPMQLEGIQRGPPAIGLLQLNSGGSLSFALSSTSMIRDHGTPCALAVHKNFIAVGMSKGTVLLTPSKYFATRSADDNETKIILLANAVDRSHAPVSALCFNSQGDLLLAGYSNGSVTLWDVMKAAVAKTVTGEHHTVIVHAAFVAHDFLLKAITADCKGVVRLHTFTVLPILRRFSVTTLSLLDGKGNGVVLSLSPLLPSEKSKLSSTSQSGDDVEGHRGDDVGGVVVLVTQNVILVVRLLPAFDVCAKLTKPDGVREGSIPYASWQHAAAPNSSPTYEAFDSRHNGFPLLALAWGKKVLIFQLVKMELRQRAEWNLDCKAIGVAWLGEILVVATTKTELCLFTSEGVELDRASIKDERGCMEDLVFNTYFVESCNNPEKFYANSLAVRGAALYLLGATKLWRARLLPWQDRIRLLQEAGDWMGAFQIAMELYDGRAKGVSGLPKDLGSLQEATMPSLLALISAYVDEAFMYVLLSIGQDNVVANGQTLDGDSSIQLEAAREQYARVGRVVVEFCVHIRRTDVLFDDMFRKFKTVGQADTFLELLEPYILKDMLSGLAPEIMQALVEHYSSRGWVQRVEQCILHMDIGSLDFNQVMKLCREHGLYSALIYLFNKGLNDFTAPMDVLLAVAQSNRPDARSIGYKLLVYLKYCFSGLAYPPGRGYLPPDQLPELREQLLKYLLDPEMSEQAHGNLAFPRMFYILHLDTKAALDVISLAFQDMPRDHELPLIQLTVDAIVHIIEITDEIQAEALLDFVMQYVSSGKATVPSTTLSRIFNHLTSTSTSSEKSRDQEDLMVATLKAVPESDWDPDRILLVSQQASFWKVCALIYSRKGDHIEALRNHLKDFRRPYYVFQFIVEIMDLEPGTGFCSAVYMHLPQLMQINREATVFLVLRYFNRELNKVMDALRSSPESLFYFYKTVMEIHSHSKESLASTDSFPQSDNDLSFIWKDRSKLASLLENSNLDITNEMVEQYTELMCQFEPDCVLKFLQSYESYRLEQCLKLCQKYDVRDAAAFLLERVGDVGGALSLTLTDLAGLLLIIERAAVVLFSINCKASIDQIPEVATMHSLKNCAVHLCQRNTFRLDHQEAESLWFHLLDRFVEPLQAIVCSQRTSEALQNEFAANAIRRLLVNSVGDIITGMIGYVALHVILRKILMDHGTHRIGDFRLTIMEMLTAYGYEVSILGSAKKIIEGDMFQNVVVLKAARAHGYCPTSSDCCLCGHELDGKTANTSQQENTSLGVRIFLCGHAVHVHCEGDEVGIRKEKVRKCPVCLQKGITDKNKRKQDQQEALPSSSNSNSSSSSSSSNSKDIEINAGVSRFDLLNSFQERKGSPVLNAPFKLKLSPALVWRR